MYFPGDPLFPFDPIFNSVTDAKARERMICRFDLETTKPEWALGYIFDIVLRGRNATPPDHRPCLSARPRRPSAPTCTSASCPGAYRRARDLRATSSPTPACPARTSASRAACSTARATSLPDALVEIWQADSQGRYAHPADGRPLASNSFRGFGRCPTDKDGGFRFATVKPGAVPGPAARTQAPHINVGVFSRGILKRLFTRIYFAGDPANASDPILALVPADRRDTLMAKPDPAKPGLYRFDIRLQGDGRDRVLRRVTSGRRRSDIHDQAAHDHRHPAVRHPRGLACADCRRRSSSRTCRSSIRTITCGISRRIGICCPICWQIQAAGTTSRAPSS